MSVSPLSKGVYGSRCERVRGDSSKSIFGTSRVFRLVNDVTLAKCRAGGLEEEWD